VVLAALLLAALLGVRLAAAGGPSGLVVAGDAFVGPDRPADLAVVHEGSTGYDGQFVYRLALDPFTRAETADGIRLDNPPYRQQRVGLPALAWALTKATPLPLSVALVLVNALALLAAAWAGAVLARRMGRHALWGVLVALSPALVIAVTRDLTEPLATALLLLGLVAWTGGRTALATVAFVAAVLTRETTLAVLAGLGLYETFALLRGPDRLPALRRAALLLVPVAVDAAWQAHLRGVWGELPVFATAGGYGAPFVQTARTFLSDGGDWSDWTSTDALLAHAWLVERVLLAGVLLAAAVLLGRSRLSPGAKIGWVLGTLLGLSASWGRDIAFLRASNEAIVMGVLVLLGSRARVSTAALGVVAGMSVFVGGLYGALL
jgi:hypothetical protein